MNNKITSIAAALVAKAGTNASAGIGASTIDDKSLEGQRKRVTTCMNNINPNASSNINSECNKITGSCDNKQHQIGTNLAELSVCWHKTSWPEQCARCGEPFYKGIF